MSHYDVLGLTRNATQAEIRLAWQRASAKVHPDREGGSDEAQARVNKAHDVLSNPERREYYDRTGHDELPGPHEKEVEKVLLGAMNNVVELLNENPVADPVAMTFFALDHMHQETMKAIETLRVMLQVLPRQLNRVHRKNPGVNLYDGIVRTQISLAQEKIPELEARGRLILDARKELANYFSLPVPVHAPQATGGLLGGLGSIFGGRQT